MGGGGKAHLLLVCVQGKERKFSGVTTGKNRANSVVTWGGWPSCLWGTWQRRWGRQKSRFSCVFRDRLWQSCRCDNCHHHHHHTHTHSSDSVPRTILVCGGLATTVAKHIIYMQISTNVTRFLDNLFACAVYARLAVCAQALVWVEGGCTRVPQSVGSAVPACNTCSVGGHHIAANLFDRLCA